jgi:hypothetical protein
VGVIDFEETMLHDPVYDIAVLTAAYLLWCIRFPGVARRIRDLALGLLQTFMDSFTCFERNACSLDPQDRINNYMAGAMMDRVTGIGRAPWSNDDEVAKRVRRAAWLFLSSPHLPSADIIRQAS